MNAWLRKINGSLLGRLESRLLLPLLVLFLTSGGWSYGITRYYADQVYDRWLYDSANSLATQVRLSAGRVELDLPLVAQQMFQWDDEDETLYRVLGSSSGHIAGIADGPAQIAEGTHLRNATLFDQAVRGREMRWAAVQLQLAPGGEQVSVMVGETMRKRSRLATEILWSVWIAQLVLLLVVAWITHQVVSSQTRKLHVLSGALRDISHRELRRVPVDQMPQELRPLVDELNSVIARLEQAALAQRAFIANAAHQLRTPLTALSLQAEQAAHCSSLAEMRQALEGLRQAAQRSVRLANQLLLLSRAEPDAQLASLRAVTDLRALAFEVGSEWIAQALQRGLSLEFDETSVACPVLIDAALMREAINNLLDNAIKYGSPGDRILLGVHADPEPCLWVDDSGPGIPPEDRHRVLQRFHRGDSGGGEGSGLGLAIVREIADAHAGGFDLRTSSLGGLCCVISLPARRPIES